MTVRRPFSAAALLYRAELFVAGFFFVVMLGVVVVNVFLRYLFSTSILFTEELAYIGFTWSVFAAVAWMYRTRALIAVDVFFGLIPQAARRVVSTVVDIGLVLANAWFCWLAWVLASGGFTRKTPVLEVPYFWINLAPLLAFGLMALYSAWHFWQGLTGATPVARSETPDICEGPAL